MLRLPAFRLVQASSIHEAVGLLAECGPRAAVGRRAPCLAQAASLIASPQLRRAGTLGGNVLIDTRCQYYNQSHFWRSALGFCLKKDGTLCHVVAGGSRCVAAASADAAYRQCHTLPNVAGDDRWRREMIPVDVERTLRAAAAGDGPVHHV